MKKACIYFSELIFLLIYIHANNLTFAQCSAPDKLFISYSCPTAYTAAFTANASPCVTNLHWDFGDPASGEFNKASGAIRTHTFFKPGSYTVTLAGTGQNGKTLTTTLQIGIIAIEFKPLWTPLCFTNNYPCEIIVTGGVSSKYDTFEEYPGVEPFHYTGVPYQDGWFSEFYSPGVYKITLNAPYTCPAVGSYNYEPTSILPLSHTITSTAADCSVNNGAVSIAESGGTPPYTYAWRYSTNTSPKASDLYAGYYYITVQDKYGCVENVTASVSRKAPFFKYQEDSKQPLCTANGTISINTTGGTSPYSYIWVPAVSSSSTASGLAAGSYNIHVKDKNGCTGELTVKLQQQTMDLLVHTNSKAPDCGLSDGSITLQPSNGVSPYSYTWQSPVISKEASADNLPSGTYNVIVADKNGCTDSVTTTLYSKSLTASLGDDTFLCPGKPVLLSPGMFTSYLWNNGTTQPTLTAEVPGTYSVMVTNAAGCTAKASVLVETGCGNITFPSAFTPNGDFINDQFGPVGSLSRLKNYSLQIYNRLGSLVFRSQNPYDKWKVRINKLAADLGTYIFIAQYETNSEKKVVKGTVTVLF